MQLSGKEQQRIGIASAVVNKPGVANDEPTGNSHDVLSEGILSLFREFNCVSVTVLMATYDIGLIARRYYRIFTLNQGKMSGGMANKIQLAHAREQAGKTAALIDGGEGESGKI